MHGSNSGIESGCGGFEDFDLHGDQAQVGGTGGPGLGAAGAEFEGVGAGPLAAAGGAGQVEGRARNSSLDSASSVSDATICHAHSKAWGLIAW